MPKLEIQASGTVRTVDFNGPALSIGRLEANDVMITDPVASRRHCVIERTPSGFRLKDLQSHNGTWLGNKKVIEVPISIGQVFRIGGTTLRIVPDDVQLLGAEDTFTDAPASDVEPETPDADSQSADVARRQSAEANRRAVAALRQPPALPSGMIPTGPLTKQLAPLMQACDAMPTPDGAPHLPRDIKLVNRKGEAIVIETGDADRAGGEAAMAMRQLLFAVFKTRATDIHIEAKEDVHSIRFRIDGLLHSVGQVTAKMGLAILNVVKVLCQLDISKKSVVQEGSFAADLPDRCVEFRVNMTPTMHGQKLALRVLDKGTVPSQFENLGMDLDVVAELTRICERDAGMIVLAGPTGSGKTTTLYTALQTIDACTRNIVTIEDPVEYELENTTQISIDPKHDLTFASILSSVLRQDPDVILVGEIRDNETAKMAMQAATTGHLVLTTIHARDTIGTIFRMLDLGVEPFLVANAVSICISQRLVRTLCPNCRRAYKPDASLIRRMNLEGRPHGDFYEAVGCTRCMGTGYRGRIALYETLLFTPQVRDVILTNPTISDIRKAAGEWMFATLMQSGCRKVIEGITTLQEVERVAN